MPSSEKRVQQEYINKIAEGDFAIVRKVGGEHMRLCRLRSGQRVLIERLSFDPKQAIGRSYGMFEVGGGGKVLIRVNYTSMPVQTPALSTKQMELNNGIDVCKEQEESKQLTGDQILALKDGGIATSELVSKLVSGNNLFSTRTKFSKDKYVRKKTHKHSDRIIISKPNIRLIAECYYRKDSEKLGHLRMDQLGFILQLAGVHSGNCNVFVFDQVLGLLGAAVLERLNGHGSCVFLHRGDWPQSIPCLEAADLNEQQMNALLTLRVTTLLKDEIPKNEGQIVGIEDEEINCQTQPNEQKRRQREQKECNAMELIRPTEGQAEGGLDAICMAIRNVDPVDLLRRVYNGLRLSGTVVLYSPIRQYLLNVWEWLRSSSSAVDIHLSQHFQRAHQVLPDRTHPIMLQSVTGGYVLYATKVQLPQPIQTHQRELNKELLTKHEITDEMESNDKTV